jgi:hypothetical protein
MEFMHYQALGTIWVENHLEVGERGKKAFQTKPLEYSISVSIIVHLS